MPIHELIEQCAKVADDTIQRLKAMKPAARHRKQDQHSMVEIDYAILTAKRIATGIRALDVSKPPVFLPPRDPRFEEARTLLHELLPSVEQSRDTAWKASTIERIKELLKD